MNPSAAEAPAPHGPSLIGDPIARIRALATECADALPCATIPDLTDADTLALVTEVERLGRRVDALRVTLAGEVADRSRPSRGARGLAVSRGCRTPADLIEQLTQVAGTTARRRVVLAGDVRRDPFLGGDRTRARFDLVAQAVEDGTMGIDAATVITKGLTPLLAHGPLDELGKAETELVAAATGTGPDSTVPASADSLRVMVSVWQAKLDPDGLDPAEDRAMAVRDFRFGPERNGLLHGSFRLMAEAGGRVKTLFDAYLTPTTAPAFMSDEERAAFEAEGGKDLRTPAQQRHDIFVAIIDAMARSGQAPEIGGAAPTVLVSVRAEDLEANRGVGWSDRVEGPVSMRTVRQMVCTGGIQKVVLTSEGRIVQLGSPERCFTPQQRRAISLRDGGCVIPGCTIPAGWCEIHHVVPDRDGGPTHPDNGVLLCWFHHRTIDTSQWQIRMRHGLPEVKPPPWIEYFGTWRPATKSRTRLLDRLDIPPE
ncbi:HNH endonuclease signature motif containing protein [Planctomonas psychrotolerans]|uniref:HNH endonuclease signature motif containing protein n=1 Tax=Planctomonas psychrotolerans TaxID=2528712 RepID=UPI0012386AD1|nr:HNH endonuclease signature motif containing protein [Planctomonas psychrotolerans]